MEIHKMERIRLETFVLGGLFVELCPFGRFVDSLLELDIGDANTSNFYHEVSRCKQLTSLRIPIPLLDDNKDRFFGPSKTLSLMKDGLTGKPRLKKLALIVGQCRSQEGGGGNFKLVMLQSSHRFGLAASSPNLSESSLAGWAPVLRLRCAQHRTIRARVAAGSEPTR
ncbi:MAG: hypothetical protein GY696_25520, partial [Gammaproteobacteria bacterium]|nr:hypothetical protein [Gammaproteobacteria bacterium]